jgi:7-carboxy-7-deazaguanine synthase
VSVALQPTGSPPIGRLGASPPNDERLYVAEVFGPTLQGEGPSRGQLAAFVRLGGCNLHCAWCDTPYTWDASRFRLRDHIAPVDVADVVASVTDMRARLLVITGGEPLLQQRRAAFGTLLRAARRLGMDVEIETNGTQLPDTEAMPGRPSFNVSPKLANGGDRWAARVVPQALAAFTKLAALQRARFKFVATGPEDLAEVDRMVTEYDIPPSSVWVMPEGTSSAAVISGGRALVDPVLRRRYNLTLRDHILLWDDERGH